MTLTFRFHVITIRNAIFLATICYILQEKQHLTSLSYRQHFGTFISPFKCGNWCPFLCSEQLMQLYCARQRRRLNRGLRRKQQSLLKRLRKAKKEAPPMEKPEVVKTHLRDMVILPEMVGSMVGVYNGKTFNQVEIKVRRSCSSGRVLSFVGFLFLTWGNSSTGVLPVGALLCDSCIISGTKWSLFIGI